MPVLNQEILINPELSHPCLKNSRPHSGKGFVEENLCEVWFNWPRG